VIILSTTYAVLSLAPRPVDAQSRIPSDVKKHVRARVRNDLSSCIVVGVIDETGTSYFSRGTLSHEGERKADKNTVFEIGSITKVFTSILLADLVERGVANPVPTPPRRHDLPDHATGDGRCRRDRRADERRAAWPCGQGGRRLCFG